MRFSPRKFYLWQTMDQPRWLIQQLLWHTDKIGSWRWARVASVLCKLFNLQCLISHLTNSNDCGNIRPKVLLTVSPFRLLLRPALHFHSRSDLPASPLSTAFTPIRSLTPLSTVFTQNTGGGVSRMRLLPSAHVLSAGFACVAHLSEVDIFLGVR